MVDYHFNCNKKEASIQIEKNYTLRIEKLNNNILITKEEKKVDPKEEYHIDLTYSLSGHITANDIHTNLANIHHIGFEVTDACNLKCTYCIYGEFYNNHDDRTNKQIDIRKAKLLIAFLVEKINSPANNSPIHEIFISFYGGEPLLNMEFIKEIVHYTQHIQNNHIKFNYMMTTNAIYLKKYFDFLFQYDFMVTVSLDGSKENDAHRKFPTGKSSFEIVYNNIKYIQENYADYFDKKIRFIAVMHNQNNIQDVFSFFYHEFGKIPHFSRVTTIGIKPELQKAFDKLTHLKPSVENEKLDMEMTQVLDLTSSKPSQLQSFIFHYSGNVYDNYNELLVKKEKIDHLPTETCIPFSKRIFMTVNNKIFPCERIGHQFSLGEVTDQEVKIDGEYVAKKYNGYYDSLRRQCQGCYNKRHCGQCMFEIRNLGNHPVCDKVANKQMFNEYLQKNMEFLATQPSLYKRIMEEIIVIK